MKHKTVVTFCPMVYRHFDQVYDLEKRVFSNPWEPVDFRIASKCAGGGIIVAERRDEVIGYCAYKVIGRDIQIHNLAVDTRYRRQGIGSSLVSWVRDSLLCGTRRVSVIVRETNLEAQVFFRARGFRALGVISGHYDDTDDDGYRFAWCYWGPKQP